jgi:hypothetical protein
MSFLYHVDVVVVVAVVAFRQIVSYRKTSVAVQVVMAVAHRPGEYLSEQLARWIACIHVSQELRNLLNIRAILKVCVPNDQSCTLY